MFAHRHNTNKLSTAAKARLNTTHSHKLENIESRKRSPDTYPETQLSSSSDVMVFTNTHHGNFSGGGRQAHPNTTRSLPEYPDVDLIQNYFEKFWDQKMRELNEPNSKLRYLHLGKPNEKNYRKESTSPSSSSSNSSPATVAGPPTKQRSSPQHVTSHVKRF